MPDSAGPERGGQRESLLQRRQVITDSLANLPYDLILYLERSAVHEDLLYPDLAAGDAYRSLLLADEVLNDGYEYHEQAYESLLEHVAGALPKVLSGVGPIEALETGRPFKLPSETEEDACNRLATLASVRCYQVLSSNLLLLGCLKSAYEFCERGLTVAPQDEHLTRVLDQIRSAALRRLGSDSLDPKSLPDRGLARREIYPWNTHEPDRYSPETLAVLNAELSKIAPKCSVRVAELPVLRQDDASTVEGELVGTGLCRQLGLFAIEDIAPGETVLEEYSLLTANNRLKESMCDACSSALPPLGSDPGPVGCPDCCGAVVFCSQFCLDQASERYHPAVCDKEVDAIARDPDAREADETLHFLLLARVLAMASHQEISPLDVLDVKYIWGDFVPSSSNDVIASPDSSPPPQWTLPFSFEYNIRKPIHFLESMDIDIYETLQSYDVWILNTLFSKFRGTASAKKNPRDGRPDVAAVHPLWCLANHDCDPNVTWDWDSRMVLSSREKRVVGGEPGVIRAGQEILNHYCDVTLPVQERREWAEGSLGGWCMCDRCRREAAQEAANTH